MERNLENAVEEIMSQPKVFACVVVDKHGMCLAAKGKASSQSAGVIAAIAEHVSQLEPKEDKPIISLHNDDKCCIIQKSENVITAVYKAE